MQSARAAAKIDLAADDAASLKPNVSETTVETHVATPSTRSASGIGSKP
jgi:hypothetical protein